MAATVVTAVISVLLGLISGPLASWLDTLFTGGLSGNLQAAFWIERELDSRLMAQTSAATDFAGSIRSVYDYIYLFSCGVMVLKLLYKGLKIYGFWRDGDADNDPKQLLVGVGFAVGTAVAFPVLYDLLAGAATYLFGQVSNLLGGTAEMSFTDMLSSGMGAGTADLLLAVALVVWLVWFFLSYFKLLSHGFTLMILRVGVPLAALGQLDSDGGVWKNYLQVLFQTVLTMLTQCILWSLASKIMVASVSTASLFLMVLSFCCLAAASSVPKALSRIMMPTGGGGGLQQAVYLAATAARMAV